MIDQIIDRQIIDPQIIDRQIIDRQITDRQIIERQIIDRQIIDRQIIDRQIIDQQIIDRQIIDEIGFRSIDWVLSDQLNIKLAGSGNRIQILLKRTNSSNFGFFFSWNESSKQIFWSL